MRPSYFTNKRYSHTPTQALILTLKGLADLTKYFGKNTNSRKQPLSFILLPSGHQLLSTTFPSARYCYLPASTCLTLFDLLYHGSLPHLARYSTWQHTRKNPYSIFSGCHTRLTGAPFSQSILRM